jgi:alkanesulfonate monooxygenase SsuD/methylene tetrahydromethanopterin reductase-like flavin-dependent oxidoreductase (luciferase family)
VHVDLLFDPFGATWQEVHAGAQLAEELGFDGVWLYDHLAGSVHDTDRVLECWTTLTAIAVSAPRLNVGPMVLNVANRPAGTLAVMAATLQEVSGGRLLLGMGAGGGRDTPYADEQEAFGRRVGGDEARRQRLEDAIGMIRATWTGEVAGVGGFLRAEPQPPIVIGGFGPKMAALAGRVGDGINAPAGRNLGRLIDIAREAHAQAGRNPDEFIVTASAGPSVHDRARLEAMGVDRHVVYARAPYLTGVRRAAEALL